MEHLIKTRTQTKLLKYLFLSTGCLSLILILISLYIPVYNKNFVDITSISNKPVLSKDYTLNINNSVFEGLSNDSMPYKIAAKNVTRNLNNNYLLNSVNARYLLDDAEIIVKSSNGILDTTNQFVTLKDNVQITFNEAIFYGKQIELDLKNKDISSKENVEVNYKGYNIKANNFKTSKSNTIIEFSGNVESNLQIQK